MLTGPPNYLDDWKGQISLIMGHAGEQRELSLPHVRLAKVRSHSKADVHQWPDNDRAGRADAAVLLTMLLAGMVLSNLVEEKGNKIIESLAAAIQWTRCFWASCLRCWRFRW